MARGHSRATRVGAAGRGPRERRRSSGALRVEPLEPRQMLAAGVVISEFLAFNDNDLRDSDRNRTDWIELLNTSDAPQSLGGWYLTDDAARLTKWKFPEITLEPNARLVVFASGKDRIDPAAELHTNFKLRAAGDYLGLVEPDGVTVAFDFGPEYPPQVRDVSYGIPQPVNTRMLHAGGDKAKIFVPRDGTLGQTWTAADFDDSAWADVPTGVGYGSSFGSVIETDVRALVKGVSPSLYMRIAFDIDDPTAVSALALSLQYNDGFVAMLNGVEVARRNAPGEVAWNSLAPDRRSSSESLVAETFDLADHLGVLKAGTNVIAIQAINSNVRSSRFLMAPQLSTVTAGEPEVARRSYFVLPSAGAANGNGTITAMTSVMHTPRVPAEGEAVAVSARVQSTEGVPSQVELHYRVMFGDEVTMPMFDDGLHGDGLPDDGIFGATIPGGVAGPGEMIRYRITAGTTPRDFARSPVFADPLDTEEYYGTVVRDASIVSELPVLHLFLADPAASEQLGGTRGSLFHDGNFYDNIRIDPTGRQGRRPPKKSHDVFLPRDHWFEFGDRPFRMNDFDLITDLITPAKLRIPLAYQTFQEMGTPSHLSVPVRVERNGEFFGTYAFVDGGNERFLDRAGLDPQGALYKMNLGFSSAGGFKKMTRRFEDNSDLEAFFSGLGLDEDARRRFLFDNVNIPAVINYLVGLVLTADADCCSKNLYLYRDTAGTGEWETLPWDVNSAFGALGIGGGPPENIRPRAAGIDVLGRDNVLFMSLFQTIPDFEAMYLRRVRSVLDEFLQPPGTPMEDRYFEQRIDAMVQQMESDAVRDDQKWGIEGTDGSWQDQVDILRNEYFPRRRVFLYGQVGDMDLSGHVDQDDIDDFVLALTDPVAYRQAHGVAASLRGDIDGDPRSRLDYDDIAGLVALLEGGPQPGSALLPPPQTDEPNIEFGQIDAHPESGNQDEEFIELINRSDEAIDISGWRLAGGVRHTFAPGVVLPAGGSLYVTPDVRTFRGRAAGPSGGQGRFVVGDYRGHISDRGETIRLEDRAGKVVASVTTAGAGVERARAAD